MTVLIGFDVDSIQEYVFGTTRPVDILGASGLVESFCATTAVELAEGRGAEVVYAGGGGGLFRIDDDPATGTPTQAKAEAEALAHALEAHLADTTGGAASCTAAWTYGNADFRAALGSLGRALAERKRTRWLDEPGAVLADTTGPRGLCEACGIEAADRSDRFGDPEDVERIGPQCAVRRQAGRQARRGAGSGRAAGSGQDGGLEGSGTQAGDLDDLFGGSEHRGRPGGGLLAAVYVDVDRAGERVAACASPEELCDLSGRLRWGARRSLEEAVERTGISGRFLAPVVGGDDVLVFVDAAKAAELLAAIWSGIDTHVTAATGRNGRPGLHASAGVAVADRYTPLGLLTRQAASALRRAKDDSYRSGVPHVAVSTIGRIRRSAPDRGLVFGTPVPRFSWFPDGGLSRCVEQLRRVTPAQRHGLLGDLATSPQSLRELDVDYRIARQGGDSLRRAVEEARGLAHDAGGDLWEVLLGALLATDLGWGGD